MLLQMEKEMFALAEQRYGGDPSPEALAALTKRMADMRKSIRLVRRRIGMDEISDSDVVMGINYMRDEETGTG